MNDDRVIFIAVWTALGVLALLALAAITALVVYIGGLLANVVFPAFDAWLSADAVRPVALCIGGVIFVALAVVRLEVGE